MIPRAIVALADDVPPPGPSSHTLGLIIALAIAAAAIVGGLWLAKRRKGAR